MSTSPARPVSVVVYASSLAAAFWTSDLEKRCKRAVESGKAILVLPALTPPLELTGAFDKAVPTNLGRHSSLPARRRRRHRVLTRGGQWRQQQQQQQADTLGEQNNSKYYKQLPRY
jgi:hypothetical protein